MTRVLIADDQPLFREAICGLVTQIFACSGAPFSCEEASTIGEVLRLVDGERDFSGVIIGFSVLGAQGLSQLVTLRSKLPAVPLIVLSSNFDRQRVQLCATCGVAGFISKTSSRGEIATALQTVFRGGIHLPSFPNLPPAQVVFHPFGRRAMIDDQDAGPLSGRQAAVLDLVAAGKSNKQIAWELSISETTVKAHMTAILRKLGVNSRTQAIVLLQQQPARAATPH